MIDDYISKIEMNNINIKKLINIIKKNYNRNINIDFEQYNSNNIFNIEVLKQIYNKQLEEINKLNMIIDIEFQNIGIMKNKFINDFKENEPDKVFSNFYRNGYIKINGINVSVDKFFIAVLGNKNGKMEYNFICTDKRINIFKRNRDKNYNIKEIFFLKDSVIFYDMYLNKKLYSNNMIDISNQENFSLFLNYIKMWNNKKHNMVADLKF